MSGQGDSEVFLPPQAPAFESAGLPDFAGQPVHDRLPWSKNSDDTLPFPRTLPFALTPKTPPYIECPVQNVSHTGCHPPSLPSHLPIPWRLPVIHGY